MEWDYESSASKNPAILPTSSLSSASGVPSNEEDHVAVAFGMQQLGRASLSIEADSELERAIRTGEEELNQVVSSMGLIFDEVTVEEE